MMLNIKHSAIVYDSEMYVNAVQTFWDAGPLSAAKHEYNIFLMKTSSGLFELCT